MPKWFCYHGLSREDHQGQIPALQRFGFRPVALAVAGDIHNPVYATTWVQEPGREWRIVHSLTPSQYQRAFNRLTKDGFAPVIFAASGPLNAEVFAATFERGVKVPWFARHDLTREQLESEMLRAGDEGFIPLSIANYGSPNNWRYAATWFANRPVAENPAGIVSGPVNWKWHVAARDKLEPFLKALGDCGLRCAWISTFPDEGQLVLVRDDRIGPWWPRYAIRAADYQNVFNENRSRDAWPIVVQAAGAGRSINYSAIFATVARPIARGFTVTGTADARLGAADTLFRIYMRESGTRAGALCAIHNGRVIAERGYTWAEPGYPVTQPNSRFRLASLSKMITCAALQALHDQEKLNWTDHAFPLLGVSSALPSGTKADPRINTITIEQLIGGQSGLQREIAYRDIGRVLKRVFGPTRSDLVRYVYGLPLRFPPGQPAGIDGYSNFGFVVLTSIVEKLSGESFLDFVRKHVLAPVGLSDVHVGRTRKSQRLSREVLYESPYITPSALRPLSDTDLVGAPYGDFLLEISEGSGGLVSTAPTMARFIGRHAVWGIGNRVINARGGAFEGTCTHARSLANNVDYAFMFNRRSPPNEARLFGPLATLMSSL
ncbi:MAG TPA: serine hydrolase [Allosphingosinicella sp.]|nr:serine hydrolase [Allosphingosinicella sp.]